MTPYELNLAAEIFMEQSQEQIEKEITMVWLGEYYHRIKKLPTLKEILKDIKPKKEMTADEMLEEVKRLNALFGGSVETKEGDSHSLT